MFKIKSQLILVSISIFLFSCGTDNTLHETLSYSNKIIGEWQQIQTSNITDASTNPATYDWSEVVDGFTLQLSEDGTFNYTKFEECSTGKYIFDGNLAQIEFTFDCEIDFFGESVTKITESFAEDISDNNQLFLMHQFGSEFCETTCNSILKRIE
jgi:hypothetical protein